MIREIYGGWKEGSIVGNFDGLVLGDLICASENDLFLVIFFFDSKF